MNQIVGWLTVYLKLVHNFFNNFVMFYGSIKRGEEEIMVPLFFTLMTVKSHTLYMQMFDDANDNDDFEIIIGFEKAAINALNEMPLI